MASCPRHRTIGPIGLTPEAADLLYAILSGYIGYPAYVRPSLASRVVHFVLRKPPPPPRYEWREYGSVADQRPSPPVG